MCEEICWQCKIIATPAPLQNEITIHIIKKYTSKTKYTNNHIDMCVCI